MTKSILSACEIMLSVSKHVITLSPSKRVNRFISFDKLRMILTTWALLTVSACTKTPTNALVDPTSNAALGAFGTTFVIYDEELKSGGGAMLVPGSEEQSLDFENRDGAASGAKAIRYAWTGKDILNSNTNALEHTFAGVSLIVATLPANFASTAARDLSSAGYTKVRFKARGSLSANTLVKVEAPDDGNSNTSAPCLSLSSDGTLDDAATPCGNRGALGSGWTPYTIDLSGRTATLSAVKEYFKATFIYNQPTGTTTAGTGGVIYLDDILFTQ